MPIQKRKPQPRVPANTSLPPLSESARQQVENQQQQAQQRAQQQPPQQQQQSPQQQPQQQPPQQDQREVKDVNSEDQPNDFDDIPESAASSQDIDETYHHLKTDRHGELEFDLVAHRQRGKERRFLNVRMLGMKLTENGGKSDEMVQSLMNITNKEDFENLKNFFINLNWED